MTTSPNTLLFLDFDGVTHPVPGQTPQSISELENSGIYGDGQFFKRENVIQVNRLIHELDAKVVITSSWRREFPWNFFNRLFLERVIGQTPSLPIARKYNEVKHFLVEKQLHRTPWIALDDDRAHYPEIKNIHFTDSTTGLTADDVDRILARHSISIAS